MRIYITIFLASVCMLTAIGVNGQGCSDAGFCTLSSFKPSSDSSSERRNQIKAGVSYGSADHSIVIFGNFLEYSRQLNNILSFDVRISSLAQSGNSISAFGLSDIYFNANYRAGERSKFSIGVKYPLTDGNTMKDGLPLPMDYQSSLGTFDIIAGFSYEIRKFQLVAALQQPITQNSNAFFAEQYPLNSKLRSFNSTNKFQRSGDVMLRVSYPLNMGSSFRITPGMLPIYHLENDKYTDIMGIERSITGSQGLTLNAFAYADYEINSNNALQLSAGMPLIVRDERPDGLTRSFVISLEYSVKF